MDTRHAKSLRLVLVLVVGAFVVASAGEAVAKPLKHGGHYKVSGLSGYSGTVKNISMSTDAGIVGIIVREMEDRPCHIWPIYRLLSDVSGANVTGRYRFVCPKNLSNMGPARKVSLGGNYYVHAVQVCTNKKRQTHLRAIKGMKVWGAKVGSDPISITPTTVTATWLRPHCKVWHKKVSCGSRRIAYGYNLHVGTRGITGIELHCVDVMAAK